MFVATQTLTTHLAFTFGDKFLKTRSLDYSEDGLLIAAYVWLEATWGLPLKK